MEIRREDGFLICHLCRQDWKYDRLAERNMFIGHFSCIARRTFEDMAYATRCQKNVVLSHDVTLVYGTTLFDRQHHRNIPNPTKCKKLSRKYTILSHLYDQKIVVAVQFLLIFVFPEFLPE